jgi:hypothetical protein
MAYFSVPTGEPVVCDLTSPKLLYKKSLTIAALDVSMASNNQDYYNPIRGSVQGGRVPRMEPDGWSGGARNPKNINLDAGNAVTAYKQLQNCKHEPVVLCCSCISANVVTVYIKMEITV